MLAVQQGSRSIDLARTPRGHAVADRRFKCRLQFDYRKLFNYIQLMNAQTELFCYPSSARLTFLIHQQYQHSSATGNDGIFPPMQDDASVFHYPNGHTRCYNCALIDHTTG